MGAGSFFSGLVGGYGKGLAEKRKEKQDIEDKKQSKQMEYIKMMASVPGAMTDQASATALMDMAQQVLNPGKPGGKGGKESKGFGVLKQLAGGMFGSAPKNPAANVDMGGVASTVAGAPQREEQRQQTSQEEAAKRQRDEQATTEWNRKKQQAKEMNLQPGTPEYVNFLSGRNVDLKPPNAQKIRYKVKGSDEVRIAEHVPGQPGFTDAETGQPLPEGWTQAPAPSTNSGRDLYSQYLRAFKAKYPKLDNDAIGSMASDMLLKEHGLAIGAKEQTMEINQELSGIGGGTYSPKPPAGATSAKPTPGMPSPTPSRPTSAATPSGTPKPAQQAAPQAVPQSKPPSSPPLSPLASRRWRQMLGLDKESSGGAAMAGQQKGMELLKRETGLPDEKLNSIAVERKAVAKAYSQSVERAGLFDRLNRTLEQHGELLKNASKWVSDTGVPVANMKLRDLEGHLTDTPKLVAYKAAILALQREYGQLVSGGVMSRAMPPVGSMKEASDLINSSLTVGGLSALVDQISKEAKAERVAYKDQQEDLQSALASPITQEAMPYGSLITDINDADVAKIAQLGEGLHRIGNKKTGKTRDVVYRKGRLWEVQ